MKNIIEALEKEDLGTVNKELGKILTLERALETIDKKVVDGGRITKKGWWCRDTMGSTTILSSNDLLMELDYQSYTLVEIRYKDKHYKLEGIITSKGYRCIVIPYAKNP